MIFLFPTAKELCGALGGVELSQWKYGIQSGKWKGIPVFVIGISKTNAAFASALIFSELKPEKALLAGICGAYKQAMLEIGDIFTIDKDWFVDEALFFNDSITLLSEEGFPVCPFNNAGFEAVEGLKCVSSNTVSLLSSTDCLADIYQQKTGASIENMEGAAVGLTAMRLGISVSQIRAVSNYCGEREKQAWNAKLAFNSLAEYFKANY